MSKPTHHPREGVTPIHELYPADAPVWLWVSFYADWFPGIVSSVVYPGGPTYAVRPAVFVRTAKDDRWVDSPLYLMPRNREEDPCDEESLRRKDSP